MADCLDKDFYESLEAAQPSVEELPPKPKAGVAYIGEVYNAYFGETKKGDSCLTAPTVKTVGFQANKGLLQALESS